MTMPADKTPSKGNEQPIQSEAPRGCREPCGMLSSADFLRLVILDKVDEKKKVFWRREWTKTGREFIIHPFDPRNLTPFSYDLSVGEEIYSCTHGTVMKFTEADSTYVMAPRETIVVKTREFLALPPYYSATVWPRFGMVKEAILQHMVKIDPTWFGELGVALRNLSAGDYPIRAGDQFATLVLYELQTETGMFLFRREDLPGSPRVPLEVGVAEEITKKLADNIPLTRLCKIVDGSLEIQEIPDAGNYLKLLGLADHEAWRSAVNQCLGRYPRPMDILGMNTLHSIKPNPPKVRLLSRDDVSKAGCTEGDLERAAIEHGKPFHLLPAFHELLVDTIDQEVAPRIRAEVEASLYPKTVTLTLTVLGFLSFIVASVAFLLDKYKVTSLLTGIDWPGTVALVLVSLGVTIIAALLYLMFGKPRKILDSRAITRLRQDVAELKKTMKTEGRKDQ